LNNQLIQDLKLARDDLWAALDTLDEAIEIYPGWKKREFFAHVAGWEAMVFTVLRAYLSNQSSLEFDYQGVDKLNAYYVMVRQSTTVYDARLECEINRFAILTLLEQIGDFDAVLTFPWGQNTVTEFLEGAIEHERLHLADIVQLI